MFPVQCKEPLVKKTSTGNFILARASKFGVRPVEDCAEGDASSTALEIHGRREEPLTRLFQIVIFFLNVRRGKSGMKSEASLSNEVVSFNMPVGNRPIFY